MESFVGLLIIHHFILPILKLTLIFFKPIFFKVMRNFHDILSKIYRDIIVRGSGDFDLKVLGVLV